MQFIEPDWDPQYAILLDALIEFLDSIGQRDAINITERDIRVIRALIEFYDFEIDSNQDILDIMDDVKIRVLDLEFGKNKN